MKMGYFDPRVELNPCDLVGLAYTLPSSRLYQIFLPDINRLKRAEPVTFACSPIL